MDNNVWVEEYKNYDKLLDEYFEDEYGHTNRMSPQIVQQQPTVMLQSFILLSVLKELKELKELTKKLTVNETTENKVEEKIKNNKKTK